MKHGNGRLDEENGSYYEGNQTLIQVVFT